MKNRKRFLAVSVCLIAVGIQTNAQKHVTRLPAPKAPASTTDKVANQLPIKRVSLYSNGMVYIERRGMVSGNHAAPLDIDHAVAIQTDPFYRELIGNLVGCRRGCFRRRQPRNVFLCISLYSNRY